LLVGILFSSTCGKTSESSRITDAAPAELFREVTALGGLNMREAPDKQATRVSGIPENEYVQILSQADKQTQVDGITGRWVKVRYLSKEGWVFDHFLSPKAVEKTCLKSLNFTSAQHKTPDWKVNFSCGAGNDALLSNAVAYYRKWWRDREGGYLDQPDRSRHRDIIRNIRQDLKIKERKGNVALVTRTGTAMDFATFTTNSDVWILKEGFWIFFEEIRGWGKTFFAEINDDDLPDVVSESGCCDNMTVKILIGHEKEILHRAFDNYFLVLGDYKLVPEKCDKFKLRGQLPRTDKSAEFRFDCISNKMKQIK